MQNEIPHSDGKPRGSPGKKSSLSTMKTPKISSGKKALMGFIDWKIGVFLSFIAKKLKTKLFSLNNFLSIIKVCRK